MLTCSQECLARGQCGTTAEFGDVVLGGSVGPTTNSHQLIFPVSNPNVIINGSEERTVLPLAGGEPFSARFYQVSLNDLTKTGWVAGWCVAAP